MTASLFLLAIEGFSMRKILPSPWAGVAFVFILAIGTHCASAQDVSLKNSVPSITTSGGANAEVVPNIAIISLGVETERPNAADAARDNARAAQAIIGEIKAQGIDARDVATMSVTLSPVYDESRDSNGRLTKRSLRGYIARNGLNIRVKDISKAGTLARQLIDKGANNFEGIEFDFAEKEQKYDLLRGDAVRDALRKANSYAEGLGLKLGRVLEIGTQPPYPVAAAMAPKMMAAPPREASAIIPIEPGVLTLHIEVQVTWELVQ